jgi:hypothetical protein
MLMSNDEEPNNLPTVYEDDDDGFTPLEPTDRAIVGSLLKCVDSVWSESGITLPPGTKLLALATNVVLQHWQDQRVVETISKKPLPDLEELNAAIPQSEWELDLNNQPRMPWQRTYAVYLLDPSTAEKFTYANSTTGARIAVETLQDRVAWMRKLRGNRVVPQVELSSKPMKTRFGVKQRPDFKIVGWHQLGADANTPAQIENQQQTQPGLIDVKPVSTNEELNDELPW